MCIWAVLTTQLQAKIDLVTLPSRENVELTLYKSQSMSLVRETRPLSLKEGINELQFSWLHTKIDPQSIDMIPANTIHQGIDIKNICFPGQMTQRAVWKISSTKAVSIPMQLRYLTAGLDWRAYYSAILSPDEKTMQLKGYVRVNNHSGESFDNAKIYLVMGAVNMLEPFAKQTLGSSNKRYKKQKKGGRKKRALSMSTHIENDMAFSEPVPSAIKMEKASEYAVFEIDRRENLKDKWDRQLVFLENQAIPVTNVYQFNNEKYGKKVVRLIQFKNIPSENNIKKGLPLPGGNIQIFRDIYKNQHFSYEGKAQLEDIPIGKKVQLFLGEQEQVIVEKKRMKIRTDHYQFDSKGNILSWEEFLQDRIEFNNTRPVSVLIEVICRFNATNWKVEHQDDWVSYERMDQRSVKFSAVLNKNTSKGFSYNAHIYHRKDSRLRGSRALR